MAMAGDVDALPLTATTPSTAGEPRSLLLLNDAKPKPLPLPDGNPSTPPGRPGRALPLGESWPEEATRNPTRPTRLTWSLRP